jgi:RNA polymerase primary sigma factor
MILAHKNSPLAQTQRAPFVARLAPSVAKIIGDILNSEPIKFKDDRLFKYPNARKRLFEGKYLFDFDFNTAELSWGVALNRDAGDSHIQKVSSKANLFTKDQERVAFLQYNYARYRMYQYQKNNKKKPLSDAHKHDLLHWHRIAEARFNAIIIANLGLVLAMAKRWNKSDHITHEDLIADGRIALINAVRGFDVSYGFRFSTYACRAILKQYSRAVMAATQYRSLVPMYWRGEVHDTRVDNSPEKELPIKELRAELNEKMSKAQLLPVERQILALRFPLHSSPVTLLEASRVIGLTKERVRQLQIQALGKMRLVMDDSYAEAI